MYPEIELQVLRERAERMFVVRESALYDKVLFNGMQHQTLAPYRDLPGVEEVLALGTKPLEPGARDDLPFQVMPMRGHRTNGAVFEYKGIFYLYSMGTAAKEDRDGDIVFVKNLASLVERYRPRTVHVATLSRLVRSPEAGGQLLGVFSRHVDQVIIGQLPLQLSDPTGTGKLMWQVFAMVASMERDLIVQRLTAGLVAKYLRREWIKGASAVPPGYRYDPKTHLVEVDHDPDTITRVRTMLRLLAEPGMAAWQLVDELGRLGFVSERLRKQQRGDGDYRALSSPSSKIRTLLGWLDLYETGQFEIVVRNAFAGADSIAGLPVEQRTPEQPHGMLRFRYDWGLPPGGFAPPEVFEALRRRQTAAGSHGGAAHRLRKPLTGRSWHDDTEQYRLMSDPGGFYVLRARPYEPGADVAHAEGSAT